MITDYRFAETSNRCYKFHSNPAKWKDAFRICNNEGAYLAIINSQEEADEFVNLFKKYPVESLKGNFNKIFIHVGFADLLSVGTFKTINGEFSKRILNDILWHFCEICYIIFRSNFGRSWI